MSNPKEIAIRTNGGYIVLVDCTSRRQAMAICRSYGDTADSATLYSAKGGGIAEYRRDTSGNGRRWFLAEGAR